MNQDKYVFAQLVSFLDRNHFNYLMAEGLVADISNGASGSSIFLNCLKSLAD